VVESENKLPASSQAVLRSALPKQGIRSIEMLKGGATNLNALIRLQNSDDTFVLRRYLHCRHVCEKEVYLLRFLQGVIPIPELVKADASGNEAGEPYILYRYLDGVTFRQIRAAGTGQNLATAAHALGVCLGQLLQRAGKSVWLELNPTTLGCGARLGRMRRSSENIRYEDPSNRSCGYHRR
jgi:hypothetical protein